MAVPSPWSQAHLRSAEGAEADEVAEDSLGCIVGLVYSSESENEDDAESSGGESSATSMSASEYEDAEG